MHCAQLYDVCQQPETNVFVKFDTDAYKQARKVCIQSILHTDNARHAETVERQKTDRHALDRFTNTPFIYIYIHIYMFHVTCARKLRGIKMIYKFITSPKHRQDITNTINCQHMQTHLNITNTSP